MTQVSIISGTNRPDNFTRALAQHYAQLLTERRPLMDVRLIDLQHLPDNFLHIDLYGQRSAEFQPTANVMAESSALVFVLPEYNGSFPGVAKLFVDALDPATHFYTKQAALIGLSAGKFGNLRGLDHFAGVLTYLNVRLMPFRAHVPMIGQVLSREGDVLQPPALAELTEHADRFAAFLPQSEQVAG